MIRILVALALLGGVAAAFAWVADRPGEVTLVWLGQHYETSVAVALAGLLGAAFVLMLLFGLLRFIWRLPSRLAQSSERRRRRKGRAALARGMIAAGAGDLRNANRAAEEAGRHLGADPLVLMLQAQTAQLSGDRTGAEAIFGKMAERKDTRVLGLRGLHAEARRRGDALAAQKYAEQAHRIAPLPWAGQAVLDHHSNTANWTQAIAAVEANLAQRLIDRPTANRQRAVLLTALAGETAEKEPTEALRLAREAADLAPDLVPAVALAGRLLGRRGDLRRAAKLIEKAWKTAPHPDLAKVYLDLRPGDSTADRLTRARHLEKLVPADPESQLTVARAAIDALDFKLAHQSLDALLSGPDPRPSVRTCLTMAALVEAETDNTGLIREWLSRASRAARDKAWVADGVVSDQWSPVSPVTGKLDAFRWQTPPERLSAPVEPLPEAIVPELKLLEAEPVAAPVLLEEPAAATPAAIDAPAADEDASNRLAAIRAAAKAAPGVAHAPRKPDVFPLVTAPDDPGPDPRG